MDSIFIRFWWGNSISPAHQRNIFSFASRKGKYCQGVKSYIFCRKNTFKTPTEYLPADKFSFLLTISYVQSHLCIHTKTTPPICDRILCDHSVLHPRLYHNKDFNGARRRQAAPPSPIFDPPVSGQFPQNFYSGARFKDVFSFLFPLFSQRGRLYNMGEFKWERATFSRFMFYSNVADDSNCYAV